MRTEQDEVLAALQRALADLHALQTLVLYASHTRSAATQQNQTTQLRETLLAHLQRLQLRHVCSSQSPNTYHSTHTPSASGSSERPARTHADSPSLPLIPHVLSHRSGTASRRPRSSHRPASAPSASACLPHTSLPRPLSQISDVAPLSAPAPTCSVCRLASADTSTSASFVKLSPCSSSTRSSGTDSHSPLTPTAQLPRRSALEALLAQRHRRQRDVLYDSSLRSTLTAQRQRGSVREARRAQRDALQRLAVCVSESLSAHWSPPAARRSRWPPPAAPATPAPADASPSVAAGCARHARGTPAAAASIPLASHTSTIPTRQHQRLQVVGRALLEVQVADGAVLE